MNNTALVRIKKEFDLIKKEAPENYVAFPIKDDLFTWHFTIRGADDTEFENGLYHGVIKLPTSYPLKPPNIMFLNPNGRFDINVDVCLSVTKYHREEWQAAWTIRTMLEAIIAFFPIKEDHDAIGAIDYPAEARKKLAVQSRKWKCDICGPLIDLLPEKKTRKENIPVAVIVSPTNTNIVNTNVNANTAASINSQTSSNSEKEDNRSDNSNTISDKLEPEAKHVKREKPSRLKKIELDRKSHLSNVEGVIFEDVNEYAENEEEIELNIKRNEAELLSEKGNAENNLEKFELIKNDNDTDMDNFNKEQTPNIDMKRSISDNTQTTTDFAEYLRKIRQTQFEAEKPLVNVVEKEKKIIIPKEEEVEINLKKKQVKPQEDNIIPTIINTNTKTNTNVTITSPLPSHTNIVPEKKTPSYTNTFKELTNEEIEFFDIISTVKLHKSKNTEDILQEIYNDKLEFLLNKNVDRNSILSDALNKYLEKELEKRINAGNASVNNTSNNKTDKHTSTSTLNENNTNKQKLKEMMNLFEGKEKLENLMKQKNNALKYVTKKSYKHAQTKRLRIVNTIMICIIMGVFSVYYFCRNYI